MLIFATALLATLLIACQPQRAQALAARIPRYSAIVAAVSAGAEFVGLRLTGAASHLLIGAGAAGLIVATWPLRRWPGGWLVLLGVGLNGLAMAVYGRMPLPGHVLQSLRLAQPTGTVLAGSKDIVAQGLIGELFGDRFRLDLPLLQRTTVWSIGDLLMLAGMLQAATRSVSPPRWNVSARWRTWKAGIS